MGADSTEANDERPSTPFGGATPVPHEVWAQMASFLGMPAPPNPAVDRANLRAMLVVHLIGCWTHGRPGEFDPNVIPGLAHSVVDGVLEITHGGQG